MAKTEIVFIDFYFFVWLYTPFYIVYADLKQQKGLNLNSKETKRIFAEKAIVDAANQQTTSAQLSELRGRLA